MQKLVFPSWAAALAGGLLLGAGVLAYLQHPAAADGPPTLPRRQQRALRTEVAQALHQVAADTLRAARAAHQGRHHYAAGQAAARQALRLQHLTHLPPHAAPHPAPDTAARRLQRVLAAY